MDVKTAVAAVTNDGRVTTAMLLGALLEGGSISGPWAPGDQGTSFGPWQIHLPAHPGVSESDAENPLMAAMIMAPEYSAAVAQIPATAWQSDPMDAAAEAVYLAERPAQMYPPARVLAAWTALQGGGTRAGGVPGPGGTSGGVAPVSFGGDVGSGLVSQLLGPLTPGNLARFGVAVLGVVAIGVAAYVVFA